MSPHLSQASIVFLRQLARHNDRTWFATHRDTYLKEVQQPFLAMLEAITQKLEMFSPEHIKPANKLMFRIYRDTRFSANKAPYKEHIAAWWGPAGAEKTSGAGYYLHISGKELRIAAGIYMPTPQQLSSLRQWIADHGATLQAVLDRRDLRKQFTEFYTDTMKRVPRGYAADHPYAPLLKLKSFGVSTSLAAEEATKRNAVDRIATYFKTASPLVQCVNLALPISRKKALQIGF